MGVWIVNLLLGVYLALDAFVKLGIFTISTKTLGVLELVVGIAIIVLALVFEYHRKHGGGPTTPVV